jgi:hypothetical protein
VLIGFCVGVQGSDGRPLLADVRALFFCRSAASQLTSDRGELKENPGKMPGMTGWKPVLPRPNLTPGGAAQGAIRKQSPTVLELDLACPELFIDAVMAVAFKCPQRYGDLGGAEREIVE